MVIFGRWNETISSSVPALLPYPNKTRQRYAHLRTFKPAGYFFVHGCLARPRVGVTVLPPTGKPRFVCFDYSFISFILARTEPENEMAANTTPATPLPSPEEAVLARESGRTLSAVLATRAETQRIEIIDDKGSSHAVRLPVSALRLLIDVLTEIGEGNAVSIIPIHAELTTQEAADVLNVSRPFLVQLLERGEIPFHRVGTHRRVRYQDVLDYKERIDAQRRRSLEDLAEQAQKLNMGYE